MEWEQYGEMIYFNSKEDMDKWIEQRMEWLKTAYKKVVLQRLKNKGSVKDISFVCNDAIPD